MGNSESSPAVLFKRLRESALLPNDGGLAEARKVVREARENGHLDAVLATKGGDFACTAFLTALCTGSVGLARFLADSGSVTNEVNSLGSNGAVLAAYFGKPEALRFACRLYREHGSAALDIFKGSDIYKFNVAHTAAFKNMVPCLEVLAEELEDDDFRKLVCAQNSAGNSSYEIPEASAGTQVAILQLLQRAEKAHYEGLVKEQQRLEEEAGNSFLEAIRTGEFAADATMQEIFGQLPDQKIAEYGARYVRARAELEAEFETEIERILRGKEKVGAEKGAERRAKRASPATSSAAGIPSDKGELVTDMAAKTRATKRARK